MNEISFYQFLEVRMFNFTYFKEHNKSSVIKALIKTLEIVDVK